MTQAFDDPIPAPTAHRAARVRRTVPIAALATLALLVSPPADAHDLTHRVEQAEAIVVSLAFGPGRPMADASFRVFGPDPGPAFSVGRTDSRGQLAFQPDRPGTWRVVVSSTDGHGASLRVEVDESLRARTGTSESAARWPMVLAGLGYILGLAGLASLWKRRH